MRACAAVAHTLDLSRPRVMGILNVTPDSFSDGGRFVDRERALDHARQHARRRRGHRSTSAANRRGRAPTPVAEADELARVLPIVETLAGEGVLVSDRHDEAGGDARGGRGRRVR